MNGLPPGVLSDKQHIELAKAKRMIGQQRAKTICELEERINEVEAENKILREGIARLSRITHIETQEAGK